jgi:hypothetical protein
MKKIILSLILLFLGFSSVKAQENILQESGNVGIGTINPTEKLVVRGKVHIDSMLVVKDSILVNKDIRVKKNFKVEKDVRFTSIDTATNLNNKSILLIQPNGKLTQINQNEIAQNFGSLIYASKNCTPDYLANPTWMNGSKKIFTKCPDVFVGINNNVPRVNLDVEGTIYGKQLSFGSIDPSEIGDDLFGGKAYNSNPNKNIFNIRGVNNSSLFKIANDGNITIGNVANTDAKLKIDVEIIPSLNGKKALVSNYVTGIDYSYANIFNINRDLTKALVINNTATNKENIVLYGDGTANVRRVNITSELNNAEAGILFMAQNAEMKVFQIDNNGLTHAREIKVDLSTTWPDYVFEKDYKLMPLSEVEKFIKENKHLPEVPSASEVHVDGINLAEMNKILMQKIEELTLHLIEQNKRIEFLESETKK